LLKFKPSKVKKTDFIVGNGWDQNDWVKEFPSKAILINIFRCTCGLKPSRWARNNSKVVLAMANITKDTKVSGGQIEIKTASLLGY
jgi:hypothetical protein